MEHSTPLGDCSADNQKTSETHLGGDLIDELIRKGVRDVLIREAKKLTAVTLKVLQAANK